MSFDDIISTLYFRWVSHLQLIHLNSTNGSMSELFSIGVSVHIQRKKKTQKKCILYVWIHSFGKMIYEKNVICRHWNGKNVQPNVHVYQNHFHEMKTVELVSKKRRARVCVCLCVKMCICIRSSNFHVNSLGTGQVARLRNDVPCEDRSKDSLRVSAGVFAVKYANFSVLLFESEINLSAKVLREQFYRWQLRDERKKKHNKITKILKYHVRRTLRHLRVWRLNTFAIRWGEINTVEMECKEKEKLYWTKKENVNQSIRWILHICNK